MTQIIHPATLQFLVDLNHNNNRDWFAANRSRYDQAKQEVIDLGAELIRQINTFDNTLGYPDPRKSIFRINRDTRFSHNKDPYKTNLGMAFQPVGMPHGIYACYYMHIEPGSCFLSSGIYMPPPPTLKAVRSFIQDEWEEFQAIISDKTFRTTFGELSRTDKVLKRAPSGFPIDSPAIEYLKLTSFYVQYPISDPLICSADFLPRAVEVFKAAMPFNLFLQRAIRE